MTSPPRSATVPTCWVAWAACSPVGDLGSGPRGLGPRGQTEFQGPRGQTEFQVNLKLGLTPPSDPAKPVCGGGAG